MSKNKTIIVKGSEITVIQAHNTDYISMTDMVRNFEDGFSLIEKWLRNKNTIEFIGIGEQINNSDFNSLEFEGIMNEAGTTGSSVKFRKYQFSIDPLGIAAE